MELGKIIEAEDVVPWKWGYKCPECNTDMQFTDDDAYDKLDKEALTWYACPKCSATYSALHKLVSLRKES